MNGKKTYTAALVTITAGVGLYLAGELTRAEGVLCVLAGMGLAGLRHAIEKGGR